MEFFNIGGGELLVIVLLALILFGPEDIMKMMRTLGKYARSARGMWAQFNATLQNEYLDSEELGEVLEETKATVAEAQEVMKALNTSVGEVTTAIEKDVAEAQKTVRQEGTEAAVALKGSLQPQPQKKPALPGGTARAEDGPEVADEDGVTRGEEG